jgi:hypothetical protein
LHRNTRAPRSRLGRRRLIEDKGKGSRGDPQVNDVFLFYSTNKTYAMKKEKSKRKK